MALTVTETTNSVFGDKRVVFALVDFDSSYPTGGEAITAADVPSISTAIEEVVITTSSPNTGLWATYDRTAGKIVLFTAAGSQAANASDQSAVTEVGIMVIGY